MEERAPQMGVFFIRYVTFTSTLVYSVIYYTNVGDPVLGGGVSIPFGALGGGWTQPPGENQIHDDN